MLNDHEKNTAKLALASIVSVLCISWLGRNLSPSAESILASSLGGALMLLLAAAALIPDNTPPDSATLSR